ncbi:MAG: hypothetical protein ACT4OX_05095 [Actinomycetota bacterium]
MVAFVGDLMDRSRITAAVPDVVYVSDPTEVLDAAVAIVDLARRADAIAALRAIAPSVRIVAFGPHVDADSARAAQADGADVVLPRSRFFRDVAVAIT